MCTRLLIAAVCFVASAAAIPSAQSSDLDAFMSRVLARRDENWKKLQQYVLDERETFQLTGLGGAPLYGFRREYTWFPRNGVFVKSPVSADGVTISDADRRREEERWVRREERRERRRARDNTGRRDQDDVVSDAADRAAPGIVTEATMRDALEPGFVSAAYFLRFKFDPGHYAFAGTEQRGGREILKIEYYPTRLFEEGRTRPNRDLRERDEKIVERMNKVSLVTLWIDRSEHQIVEYDFRNIDMDFLPGGSFFRIDRLSAAMRMGQPFPGVSLPSSLGMQFDVTLAIGSVHARYDVSYSDYRLATVTTKVR